MFGRNCLYRHINCRSVAIEVLKTFYVREKDLYKVKVRWYMISSVRRPWPMSVVETIKIPANKVHEWKKMGLYSMTDVPTQFMVTIDEQGRIQETPIGK